jgi:hypothetical protein
MMMQIIGIAGVAVLVVVGFRFLGPGAERRASKKIIIQQVKQRNATLPHRARGFFWW